MTTLSNKLPGVWTTYDNSNGLPAGVICMAQDADGYLWLGTFGGGLVRFDGVQFDHYTTANGLAHNHIRDVFLDQYDHLWIRMWAGGDEGYVDRYDKDQFIAYTGSTGTPNFYGQFFREADGPLWAISESGLIYRYHDHTFILEYSDQQVLDSLESMWKLFRDSRKQFWMGTTEGDFYYHNDAWHRLTTEDGLIHNNVRALCEDALGRMWFGTEAGVTCYDGQSCTNYTTENGLVHNEIWAMYCDRQNRVWIGAFGGGITCYDGSDFVIYTAEDGLLEETCDNILQDTEGNLWFAHATSGLTCFEPAGFEPLTSEGITDSGFTQDPEGRIWYGSLNELGCIDGPNTIHHHMPAQINGLLADTAGGLWVGTWGDGIYHFPDRNDISTTTFERFLPVYQGEPQSHIPCIHEDRDGHILVGTRPGHVFQYDNGVFHYLMTHDGGVDAILRDRHGLLWVGGWYGGGLTRYDQQASHVFTTEDGLPTNTIRCMLESKAGDLWLGTIGGGLVRYDGRTFQTYSYSEGMVNANITCLYEDRDHHLWIGCGGGGVHQFDYRNFQVLTRRDGLLSSGVVGISQAEDGVMIFATKRGIMRYPVRREPLPPIYMRQVVADQAYRRPESVELTTATADLINFQFRGISFKTKRIPYNYRLEGHDTDWQTTWNEQAVYEHLPSGDYRFQVVAVNRDLGYSDTPATVFLSVKPDPREEQITVLKTEVEHLRRTVSRKYEFDQIIGKSASLQQVYGLMEKAIDAGLTVLISGDTGTGKELVAKAIHYHSNRKNRPIQELNCGAIPKELIAATLFGYRKGAFTGAYEDTPGLFEAADGGTIPLDEIGEMSAEAQVHLLRVLQEQTIQRVGETKLREVDVRVIAATNRNLEEEVRQGHFRKDLYYRISVFPIRLPSLRERPEDKPVMVTHFLAQAERQFGKQISGLGPGVLAMLQAYSWPGNVRELENEVYRAAALSESDATVECHHFSPRIVQGESLVQDLVNTQENYTEAVNQFRKQYLRSVLRDCNGNRTETARRLGVHRPNLVALLKKFAIE